MWEFHQEHQHNKFVLIFYYGLSLSSAPFTYRSSMDHMNSGSLLLLLCLKNLIIHFCAFNKLPFIFFVFYCSFTCTLPDFVFFSIFLNSLFFEEFIFASEKFYMLNHVGLLFLWIFFIWCWACYHLNLNLISSTSALLFLAADINKFLHFYVVPLFKGKFLIWYIQPMLIFWEPESLTYISLPSMNCSDIYTV